SQLADQDGFGLRALLDSEDDLEEALHTCVNGLLSSTYPTLEDLREVGERLLGEAVPRLRELCRA
ncbi:MAG: hypothetical protein ACLFU2_14345, partial [Opitutales bacterium]